MREARDEFRYEDFQSRGQGNVSRSIVQCLRELAIKVVSVVDQLAKYFCRNRCLAASFTQPQANLSAVRFAQ